MRQRAAICDSDGSRENPGQEEKRTPSSRRKVCEITMIKAVIFDFDNTLMDFMMPHIDYALRKIQHLGPAKPPVKTGLPLNMSSLTERELEVIEWIKAGKTNQETASILNIT